LIAVFFRVVHLSWGAAEKTGFASVKHCKRFWRIPGRTSNTMNFRNDAEVIALGSGSEARRLCFIYSMSKSRLHSILDTFAI